MQQGNKNHVRHVRPLIRGSVSFKVHQDKEWQSTTNTCLTRSTVVPLNTTTASEKQTFHTPYSDTVNNIHVIFHHDIRGRPYDDGRWFEKHNVLARIVQRNEHQDQNQNHIEVTITSQVPPDETIYFSWAARPGLPFRRKDVDWPIVLSGVLAPECHHPCVSEIHREIFSTHLPSHPAISFRMLGDASGFSSGETVLGGLPVAFDGVVDHVQVERTDSQTMQVHAVMKEGKGTWPLEGAIAWIIRAAPTAEEASTFRGVYGCNTLVFDVGSCLARTRVYTGMKLPNHPMFMAAPLHIEEESSLGLYDLDWEDVDDDSFTLVMKREEAAREEECTILVDWEVTSDNSTAGNVTV